MKYIFYCRSSLNPAQICSPPPNKKIQGCRVQTRPNTKTSSNLPPNLPAKKERGALLTQIASKRRTEVPHNQSKPPQHETRHPTLTSHVPEISLGRVATALRLQTSRDGGWEIRLIAQIFPLPSHQCVESRAGRARQKKKSRRHVSKMYDFLIC